ncbi:hypothetical protein CH063_07266 [Colletotrichum higginsianum]|uniref:Uncharacterized protein n=1 Tax=Colletotrichum higginsianum (strain IMI 349063) TaxID=759273 RepID=H1V5J1_COLHI|nr:hypothetical protein CH063_07266 [Colletotrichum higginsianum]
MKLLAFMYILSLAPLSTTLPTPETQEASQSKYPWLNMTLSNLESVCRKKGGDELYTCTLKCELDTISDENLIPSRYPRRCRVALTLNPSVDLYDPNTEGVVDVNGAHCGAAWQWNGITPDHGPDNNYPSTGVLCWSGGSNTFQFRVAEFRSASSFELYVSHLYSDTR